jgi:very-short-patch-repair endonuclease
MKLMLAIEIDGSSHDNEEAFQLDQERQKRLEGFGVKFLRIDDVDVKHSIGNVVKSIEEYSKQLEHPPSPPLKGGEAMI